MKQTAQTLSLMALLAAGASAQGSMSMNNAVVTSYYSICPTQTTTTITVDTTTTICPGPGCGGAEPTYTITTVGPNGQTTVAEILPYTAPCPCDGGICDAVYTITRPCPCAGPMPSTMIPSGFTSAAVACDVCAQNGGPSTVTVVTPVSGGPYASQTPSMGAPYNGASASAGASAYASAGPQGAVATAGASAAASAGNGFASAGASGNANAWASNGTAAGANANAGANAAVSNGPVAPAMSSATSNMTTSMPIYHGSANRAIYTGSAVVAAIIGGLVVLL